MAKDRNLKQLQPASDVRATRAADPRETLWHAQGEVRDGAVPPTGGVAPEDAPPAVGYAPRERATVDDLVAVLDLLLRAARKGLGCVDEELEAAAEHALLRLQQLDATRLAMLDRAAGTHRGDLDQLTKDVGRDIAGLVEQIAARVEAALPPVRRSRSASR
jgi:hypothetical protein